MHQYFESIQLVPEAQPPVQIPPAEWAADVYNRTTSQEDEQCIAKSPLHDTLRRGTSHDQQHPLFTRLLYH